MTSPSSNKPDTNDSAVISRILKVLGPIVSRPSLDRPDFMGHCLAKLSQIFSADLGFLLYHESKLKSLGSHDFYAHDKNSASESYFETLQDEGLRRALFEFAQKEPYLTVERSEEVPESLAVLREHLRFQKQSSLTIIPLVYNKEVYGILGFVSYHAVPHQQTELAQSWQLLSTILGNSLGRESIRIRNIHNLSRYQILVEGLHEGVMLCDEHGVLVHTNKRLAEMLGYEPNEMTGKSSYDFVHPEDREEMQRRTAERFKMISDRYESRLVRKDKSVLWTFIQASPWTNQDGTVIGSIGAVTDISDKKRSDTAIELMLRDTASDTGDIFFRKLTRNLARIFNAKYAFVAALSADSDESCTTVAVWRDGNFIDNSAYPLRDSPTQYVLEHGFTVFRSHVAKHFPKDSYLGVEGITSYMGTPLLTSQGEKIGVLSVMDDEPLREWETGELLIQVFAQRAGAELERLSAAKETEQLQSQLIQIQKMEAIGTLASGLAHDMNNAMGVVRGHLELINEYCAAPNSTAQEQFLKIKESTNSAHQASLQAQDVITQLLDFAKPKSGQKTTFTIQDAVSETISLFSSRSLESSTVNIIDARETYRVRGDKGQLQQVITNMLLNGLAAMPRGGTITVSYFTTYVKNPSFRNLNAKPGIYVQLAISDTGVGIPKEYLGRVFEPFFSTQPQKGGTGLGLSMAYTIVQQHSGWIEVESELGKGSTFTIFLPLAPENLGSEVTTLQEETSDSIILVIDDEPAVLDLTIQFLEQFGYETKGFTRPVEALDWFQANASRVCLAILDLKMPTMDGKECLNKIKEGKKDLDIVILSGEVEHSLQQEVLALGATKFFQKPLEYRLLIDWIDNKLGHEKRPDTRSA